MSLNTAIIGIAPWDPTRDRIIICHVNLFSVFDNLRSVPELHVHVHPAADAAAVGDQAAAEGTQLPPATRQARVLPRPHRQADRRLQHHTHRSSSSQPR